MNACANVWQLNATNIDYDSHPETVTVSEDATGLIEALADSDILLFRHAATRFKRDVRAAGLGCWLKDETKHALDNGRNHGRRASPEGQRKLDGAQEHRHPLGKGHGTRKHGGEHTPRSIALTP